MKSSVSNTMCLLFVIYVIFAVAFVSFTSGCEGRPHLEYKEVALPCDVEKLAATDGIEVYEMGDISLNNGQVKIENILSSVGNIDIKIDADGTIGKTKDAGTFMKIARRNNVSYIYCMLEKKDEGSPRYLKKIYAAIDKNNKLIVLMEDVYWLPPGGYRIENFNSSSAVLSHYS